MLVVWNRGFSMRDPDDNSVVFPYGCGMSAQEFNDLCIKFGQPWINRNVYGNTLDYRIEDV